MRNLFALLAFTASIVTPNLAQANTPAIALIRDYIQNFSNIEYTGYTRDSSRIFEITASASDFVELLNATAKDCEASLLGNVVTVSSSHPRFWGPDSVQLEFAKGEVHNRTYWQTSTSGERLFYQSPKQLVVTLVDVAGGTHFFGINFTSESGNYISANDFSVSGRQVLDENKLGNVRTLKCSQNDYLK